MDYEERNLNIIADLRNGMTRDEVYEKYNVTRNVVKYVLKKYHAEDLFHPNVLSKEDIIQKLIANGTDMEYAGNYNRSSGFDLLCPICGNVQRYSRHAMYNDSVVKCKYCTKSELAIKREQRLEEHELKITEAQKRKEQRESDKMAIRESKKRITICDVCGKEFITYNSRAKRCSPECSKKYSNHKKDWRLNSANTIDKDITLGSLYKRDSGVCYICGGKCNWDDYVVVNGTIVCGDWYPSIEHILPLSKGGLHSWSNVRLAHRRCNYTKRDSLPMQNNGQLSLFTPPYG